MYQLKGENDLFNPIQAIAQNRGLSEEDLKWFMNPTRYELSNLNLSYIGEGVQKVLEHVYNKNKIHVVVDSDLDGYTSAAIMISYLRQIGAEPTFNLHKEKRHGIEIDLIPEGTELIIAPDSLSNEYDIYEKLSEQGIDIVLLDHHEADHASEYAITVNPKLSPDYENKEISGAGVVYKVIQELDRLHGVSYADHYLDLVAIGMIGDSMSMAEKETRWLTTQGLKNIKNKFLQELVKKNVDEGSELNINAVSFKLNPQINGMIRVGTEEEKMELLQALLGHEEITINPKLRRPNKEETYAERVVRLCKNAYTRQRRMRDKIVGDMQSKIENEGLLNNRFLVLEMEEVEENFTGYLASKLVGDYRKPVLILRNDPKEEGFMVGSLRGYDPMLDDTKAFLTALSLFEMVGGHSQAAGIKIKLENLKMLNDRINEALYEMDTDESYLVDLVMGYKMMNESFIKDMDRYSSVWSKGLDEPKYSVTDLEIHATDISIGKNNNMMKFAKNGVEYILFGLDQRLVDLKEDNKLVVIDVVGKTGINKWQGNETPQFVIEAIDIKEVKDVGFVF